MANCVGRAPRIAVVGCSWFAREAHLPALRQLSDEGLVDVVALCSRTQQSLSQAQALLSRPAAHYTQLDELLARPDIDAVDLVLPTPLMDDAIRRSLAAGKHVISEKPCAATVARSVALLADYDRAGGERGGEQSWSVAENWPFKPTVVAIQNILRNGVLGPIESLDFLFKSTGFGKDYQGWRVSPEYRGGFLLDSSVHYVSMLRLLTGGIAEIETAVVGRRADTHAAMSVDASVRYENGVRGTFKVDMTTAAAPDEYWHLTVRCGRGVLKANFSFGLLLLQQSGGPEQLMQVPNDPWVAGGVYAMLRHCCDAMSKGVASSCTPMEGLKDVAAVEAMLEASRLGSPVMPAVLHRQLNGCGPAVSTYGNLQRFRPRHQVNATSVADVRTALREAASSGLKVRPMGGGYSWARYARSDGVSLSTAGLRGVIGIDRQKKTVRAAAGTRLGEITKLLAAQQLSLPSLPFLANGTVGAMVATATHGTSPRWGTLSDAVVSMTLATASGELLQVDAERSDADLMRAARVSVGMLGVITEVELQAVDMKWARNVRIDISVQDFIRLQPVIFANYEHLWVHWVLGSETLFVQALETSATPRDGFVPYVADEAGSWVLGYHHGVPELNGPDAVMLSMQYGLPLARLADAVQRVSASEFGVRNAGREIEMKFLQRNPASFLGPNSEDDMVLFNTYWSTPRGAVDQTFGEFEQLMQGLGGRPHWGKFHQPPDQAYLRQVYPQWARFDAIRQQLDPAGMFALF